MLMVVTHNCAIRIIALLPTMVVLWRHVVCHSLHMVLILLVHEVSHVVLSLSV